MGRRRAVRAMVAAAWFIAFVLPSGVPRAAETAPASQDCSAAGIAAGRAAFGAAYKAGDYAGAVAVFDKLAPACFTERYPPPAIRAGIDSDYALAQHRAGSDSDCIQTLEAYSPELTKRPVPAMTRLPADLQKRIRFDFGLCRPFCDSNFTDVACYWLEADQQFDGMVQEDFRPAPCPFKAGRAALALPDGTCLAVTPSLRRFTFETATDDGPARAASFRAFPWRFRKAVSSRTCSSAAFRWTWRAGRPATSNSPPLRTRPGSACPAIATRCCRTCWRSGTAGSCSFTGCIPISAL